MDFGIASVAGITALCYLAAMAVKATAVDNKWLPVICGVIGAALGVAGMYTMPDYPATDIINAALLLQKDVTRMAIRLMETSRDKILTEMESLLMSA